MNEKNKPCICGEYAPHTHKTRDEYVIIEETNDYRSEVSMHDFDGCDSIITAFIRECKFENPDARYSYVHLRTVNL